MHKGRPLTPLSYQRNKSVPWLEANADHDGDECLTWPFKLKANGYGQVRVDGRMTPAHRAMCVLAHGKPPTPKHEAAHSCGNGHLGCVNPKHLRWATRIENVADQYEHGTLPRGERHGAAKLTVVDVIAIRSRVASQAKVAAEFGIAPGTVGKIVRREAWSHV